MTNFASQIEQSQPHINPSSTITTTESSVQDLLKLWKRRQNYQQETFKSTNHLSNEIIAPWRMYLVNVLESPQAHIIIIFLLVIDLAISIIELISSFTPTSCKNIEGNKLEALYHCIGVSILGLLFLKTIVLCVGLGRSFFEKPGYVVDGVIVGVALVLEVVIAKVGGGLLVVVSLWRVVRAVESVFELSDEAIQAKIEEVVCEFGVLREENKRLLEMIVEESDCNCEAPS